MIDLPRGNEHGPDEVANRSFPSARRGLSPEAVRRFLEEIAAQLRQMAVREDDLRRRLGDAEQRAASPILDDAALAAAVGTETGRVLQVAHEAAHELVAKAEARAGELSAQSETLYQEHADAAQLRADAILGNARDTAEALVAAAKQECQTMVSEASEARRRILADLGERRRTLHVQLEQMRAGKDALAKVVDDVAVSIGDVRSRIQGAEGEARSAADEAGYEASTMPSQAIGDPEFDVPYDDLVERISLALEINEVTGDGTSEHDTAPASDNDQGGTEATADRSPSAPSDGAPGEEPAPGARVEELFAKIRADQSASVVEADEPQPDVAHETPTEQSAPPLDESDDAGVALPAAPDPAAPEEEASSDEAADTGVGEQRSDSPAAGDAGDPEGGAQIASEEELARKQLLHRRDELLEPARSGLARLMKRTLASEQNELLDAVRHLGPRDDPRSLLDGDAARERMLTVAAPMLAEAFEAGASFALATIDSTRSQSIPSKARATGERARAASDQAARLFASEILTAVERRVLEGLDGGADEANLSSLIGIAFREWKGSRVDSAVNVHVTRTFALGVLDIARSRKVAVRWFVDDGDAPCPDCDDNGLADPQPAGEPFPTGQTEPPLHPGCRCVLVPVLS